MVIKEVGNRMVGVVGVATRVIVEQRSMRRSPRGIRLFFIGVLSSILFYFFEKKVVLRQFKCFVNIIIFMIKIVVSPYK